jgi:adenosylcobinamide-GDP ribazoletransferase
MTVLLTDKQGPPRQSWVAVAGRWPLGFIAAVQFLTIMPPLLRRTFTDEEMGRAVGWFAVVGLLLGLVLAITANALGWFSQPGVTAALVLALWVVATGALHLDGFFDTCDGVFGGRTPETRLHIMRDHHVGAFAVIGGMLLLLVKYSCVAALLGHPVALVVAPTVARGGMALAIVAFPYARTEGKGRSLKDHAGWQQLALAGLSTVLTATLAPRGLGLAVIVLGVAATVLVAVFVLRRLGGFTGDVYGALCELLEMLILLAFVAGERL